MSEKRRPTVGMGIFIPRIMPYENSYKRQILIGKRGQECKRGKGVYALPGGNVNAEENISLAASREIYEETGLLLPEFGTIGVEPFVTVKLIMVTDHYPEEDHLSLWYISHIYSNGKKPQVKEPTKCEFWQWMTFQEIAKLPGVEDKNSEQYYWLPLDVFRWTWLPKYFGEF